VVNSTDRSGQNDENHPGIRKQTGGQPGMLTRQRSVSSNSDEL
jgi:hypothetical protein